jgi:hypothetical protein
LRKPAAKCPHLKDGIGIRDGFVHDFVKPGFFGLVSFLDETSRRV